MLKKTLVLLLLLFAAVLYFEVDTLVLSERAVDFILQRQEEAPPPSGEITPTTLAVAGRTINIGDSASTVMDNFGDTMDNFLSEYGFLWSVYHHDYHDYIQIGLADDDTVCAAYTNSPNFEFCGIKVGSTMDEVCMMFGEPQEAIRKGDLIFEINSGVGGKREMDLFLYRGMYVRFFYDCFKNNTVTAIHIIEEDTELAFAQQYAAGTAEQARAMELENFYVTNALRVREGVSPVKMSVSAQSVALCHATDMAKNNYFSHTDLSGSSVMERIKGAKIAVSRVAENLAAGGASGIIMHELLMNSEGHRRNILGNYQYLGIGVAFDAKDRPYLVQNYFSPPKVVIG